MSPSINSILKLKMGSSWCFSAHLDAAKRPTLRCIAGLEIPDGGEILIGEQPVTRLAPADRDISFVFQSFSLYPHMTVRENISFPLRAVKTPPAEIAERVQAAARSLHIERLLDRRPNKLSGGEMQRVTIGRAIVRRPKVFLMDEPLSALDAKLRTEMRAEIKRLQSDLGATTIYVTHDQLEAMSMGDKIAIMYGGLLQQVGTPTEVYDQPRNLFVAGFIGSPAMNLLPCRLSPARMVFTFSPARRTPGRREPSRSFCLCCPKRASGSRAPRPGPISFLACGPKTSPCRGSRSPTLCPSRCMWSSRSAAKRSSTSEWPVTSSRRARPDLCLPAPARRCGRALIRAARTCSTPQPPKTWR
jgi:ABC-type proline/glycine betaine transport system ATPase subunit